MNIKDRQKKIDYQRYKIVPYMAHSLRDIITITYIQRPRLSHNRSSCWPFMPHKTCGRRHNLWYISDPISSAPIPLRFGEWNTTPVSIDLINVTFSSWGQASISFLLTPPLRYIPRRSSRWEWRTLNQSFGVHCLRMEKNIHTLFWKWEIVRFQKWAFFKFSLNKCMKWTTILIL